jgi:cytochrome P450
MAQAVEEVLRYDPPVQLCAGLTTCWLEQAAVPVR